ncbi:MAG TPA: hypothetical protein VNK95_08500 [Caldilineaceae bacterium]|nr:hypothetical protein [Caldilineaceae bacterium]
MSDQDSESSIHQPSIDHPPGPLLYNHLLDGVPLPEDAAAHLAGCPPCRERLARLEQLMTELAVARRSRPSPATEARYAALFAQVAQRPAGVASELAAWVKGVLAWDSRRQPLLAGVRGAGAYRLLYTAGEAEVELLVEPVGSGRRLIGEFYRDNEGAVVLVELAPLTAPPSPYPVNTVESNSDGRFILDRVPPGQYRLIMTPFDGPIIEIEPVELT